jgi:hypothetical protein
MCWAQDIHEDNVVAALQHHGAISWHEGVEVVRGEIIQLEGVLLVLYLADRLTSGKQQAASINGPLSGKFVGHARTSIAGYVRTYYTSTYIHTVPKQRAFGCLCV